LFTPQFSSLPGWSNFGNSNYHSLQVSVRKTTGPVVYGVNYVYSKGIDNTSGAENQDNVPNVNLTNGTLTVLSKSVRLRANRALADFDLRHNVNGFGLRTSIWHGKKVRCDLRTAAGCSYRRLAVERDASLPYWIPAQSFERIQFSNELFLNVAGNAPATGQTS